MARLPLLLLLATACTSQMVDMEGRPCRDGECIDGYACHPLDEVCVVEIIADCDGMGLCPSTVSAGDPCMHEGSFIPCADDVTDCSKGCRTCENGVWSDSCPDPCVREGPETCDGRDNNCSGTVDDVTDLDADCRARTSDPPEVAHFACDPTPCGSHGCCSISQCNPGFVDADGDPGTGCEAPCAFVTSTPEVCDGQDNDCDGTPDNPDLPGATDCDPFFRDQDEDGHGAYGDDQCWCLPTGEYTADTEDDCNDGDGAIYEGASEICDGKDNDCAPGTDDGADEADFGDDCDGNDTDECIEGTWVCNGTALTCSDTTGDSIEGPVGHVSCSDNDDNDCDGDEDLADSDCCGWPYLRPITIDSGRVSGTGGVLPNFPVLVSIVGDGALQGHVATGSDFRFVGTDSTTCNATPPCNLDYEIDEWEDTNGTLLAWVRLPQLSQDDDTIIHLRYGNPCALLSTEDPASVWLNGYAGVWHLSGLGDSTANGNDGGNYGTGAATGLISGARYFNGDDCVTVSDHSSLNITAELTMSAWVNLPTPTDNQKIFGKTDADHTRGYVMGVRTGVYPEIWNASGTNLDFNQGSLNANTWTHLAITWRTNGALIGYINGAEVGRIDAGTTDIGTSSGALQIGCAPWDSSLWEVTGTIDEVRLSNTPRSGDWLLTSVRNQRWPNKADFPTDGFYTVGVEQ